jgi:hypothetical protein
MELGAMLEDRRSTLRTVMWAPKRNGQSRQKSWMGYMLHIIAADGGIPNPLYAEFTLDP